MKIEEEFTQQLWHSVAPIYKTIIEHPFVVQLAEGTLSKPCFAHYLAQDILYIRADAKAFENIAKKAVLPNEQDFFNILSLDCIAIEQELHTHFLGYFEVQEATVKSPAIAEYTSFLLDHSKNSPLSVAAAALLPCFWVYNNIGKHIFTAANTNNPYQKWIDTYKGGAYEDFTNTFIQIVNRLAENANATEKAQMQHAFQRSTLLELNFFEESLLKN